MQLLLNLDLIHPNFVTPRKFSDIRTNGVLLKFRKSKGWNNLSKLASFDISTGQNRRQIWGSK